MFSAVMFHIVDDSSPPLPTECSDDLKDFLEKCFNKDPKMRPDAVTLFEHPWLKSCWGEHKASEMPSKLIHSHRHRLGVATTGQSPIPEACERRSAAQSPGSSNLIYRERCA